MNAQGAESDSLDNPSRKGRRCPNPHCQDGMVGNAGCSACEEAQLCTCKLTGPGFADWNHEGCPLHGWAANGGNRWTAKQL